MLVWEDTPRSTQPPAANPMLRTVMDDVALSSPLTSSPSAVLPAAATPSPVLSPATAGSSDRRVNAADKRIINGQTDVNQLVP
ncbi:MAG: hypothetical protein RLZZ373_332, partial [Pseudomonadota bacterium]